MSRRLRRHARVRRAARWRAVLAAGFHVPAGADPARPAERPRADASTPSPVKALALERGLPVLQPRDAAHGGRGARSRLAIAARRARRRRVRAHPAAGRPRLAAPRLPQHPRLAAAALARRGADPARDPRRRRARPASRIMQMDAGLDTGPDGRPRRGCRSRRARPPARCTTSSPASGAAAIVDALARLAREGCARVDPATAPRA